ncbi:F0F1 ATP synthase subunit delta [Actinomyces mediterranea]|uniref:F0F1 ATP synthase subunit delta n=1 Tax=Actinomyces mediterranea TaxID=1871028 RepID=UPI000970F5EC|nr:F0F1 ATP synthase subunit delta [Actinomyces mediterranea]
MTVVSRIGSVPYTSNLDDALALVDTDAMRVAEDFFGLSDIVKGDVRLSRALTDPARSGDDKEKLARDAFGSSVTEACMTVLVAIVRDHWSKPEALHDALEVLGILSVLTDAHRASRLLEVEAELFEVRHFLAGQRELRLRLSDLGTGTSHERGDLATRLFSQHLTGWTMRLLRRAVGRSRHGRLLVNLRRFAEWAARMQNKLLVTVESAVEMNAEQAARLRALLERRFNADISLAISVDTSVVGGFRLRADTTSIDASLATRIADMRRVLAS